MQIKTKEKINVFELFSATRKYEDGIASNRKKECYGEYVLRFCTHRPSRYGNLKYSKTFLSLQYENNWSEVVTR